MLKIDASSKSCLKEGSYIILESSFGTVIPNLKFDKSPSFYLIIDYNLSSNSMNHTVWLFDKDSF